MRLPAYARQIVELRRQGHVPAQMMLTIRLDSWPPEERPACVAVPQIVCPPDADPEDLDFGFVEGLDVQTAFWPSISDQDRLRCLLRQVLACSPRRLWVLNMEQHRLRMVKSLERGVEVQV